MKDVISVKLSVSIRTAKTCFSCEAFITYTCKISLMNLCISFINGTVIIDSNL